MPAHDGFDEIIDKGFHMPTTEHLDPNPYGNTAPAPKTGLTKRGKAALGIGAAVIAGGSLVGYQMHSANAAEAEAKAQEIALKTQALELERLKEMNRAAEAQRTVAAGQDKARQASIEACVKSSADKVGKGFGSPSQRDIIDDCQALYGGAADAGMQPAGASSATGATAEGDVNEGLLIGGGVLLLFVLYAAKKGTKSHPVAHPVYYH